MECTESFGAVLLTIEEVATCQAHARALTEIAAACYSPGVGNSVEFDCFRVADGEYALVASKGGAPEHPEWYHNLVADPTAVMIQDGPEPWDAVVRQVEGEERAEWYERAVAAFPPYAEYQQKTDREIPVFIASRP